MSEELTERQAEVLAWIANWWEQWGYGPSVRDVADGLGVSVNAANEHIRRLVNRGVLRQTPGIARSIRPVHK